MIRSLTVSLLCHSIPLPISCITAEGKQSAIQYVVLDKQADELKFTITAGSNTVLLNTGFSSFFRTQYTPAYAHLTLLHHFYSMILRSISCLCYHHPSIIEHWKP
jgi:hypothetical protein